MTVMDPERGGQQVWMVHEKPKQYGDHAIELHDARTGEIIFSRGTPDWKDVGRGVAADIDPRTKSYEMWAARGDLYDSKGNVISKAVPREKNFLVWWDGDLLRELLDHVTISKWNWETGTSDMLLTDPECASNNGTKGNALPERRHPWRLARGSDLAREGQQRIAHLHDDDSNAAPFVHAHA